MKPHNSGSSLGVEFVDGLAHAKTVYNKMRQHYSQIVIEKRLNARELAVSVVANGEGYLDLPVVEIKTPPGTWYDYQHKYTPGLYAHEVPAPMPTDLTNQIKHWAQVTFEALGCRDFARVDFMLTEDQQVYLLELNTIPGMTATSIVPKSVGHIGMSFSELFQLMAQQVKQRNG